MGAPRPRPTDKIRTIATRTEMLISDFSRLMGEEPDAWQSANVSPEPDAKPIEPSESVCEQKSLPRSDSKP